MGSANGWACVRRGQIGGGPGWSSLLPLHPVCLSWAVWAGQPFWEDLCYGCGLSTSAGSGSWGRTLRRRDWSLTVAPPLPGEWEFPTTGSRGSWVTRRRAPPGAWLTGCWNKLKEALTQVVGCRSVRGPGAEPTGRVVRTGHLPPRTELSHDRRRDSARALLLQLCSSGRNTHLRLSGSSPGVPACWWLSSLVYGLLFLSLS